MGLQYVVWDMNMLRGKVTSKSSPGSVNLKDLNVSVYERGSQDQPPGTKVSSQKHKTLDLISYSYPCILEHVPCSSNLMHLVLWFICNG